MDHAEVHRVCAEDAAWSARALAPLADVTMTAVYFSSLLKLDAALERQSNLPEYIIDPQHLHQMRGLGVRLRRRVDWLADASMNSDGEIDARALSEPYFDAAFETIRQMNSAGLFVAIDSAGNIHGLYLLDEEAYRIRKSGELGDLLRESIHHISHIDSVKNAGRFDGRLGVTGGIEVAHILRDLEKFCQRKVLAPDSESSVRTHVSALLGEEMTFTGEGVSMPGSSALTGQASVESIYKMKNHEGQLFKDRFLVFLRWLAARQESGQVVLLNQFSVGGSDEELLESCFKPGGFFTRHTFERHIEQGPILDRHSVPMTLVSGIMGIHQEDFHFRGENAEAAALDFNRRLRELNLQSEFTEARITVGITRGESDYICHEDTLAMRWTLDGELNHAGATDVYDRKDPGVALARLAQEFYRLVDRRKAKQDSLKPLAGNVRFNPGINRNVIPGSASITLAVRGSLSRDDADSLAQELQGFTIGTLAKRVSAGGEGIRLSRMESMSYINVHDGAMVSIDLRTATEELTNRIRKEIDSLISKLQKEFSVRAQSLVQQQVKPFRLKKSGQVLLMERSYGGSHNPNEAELQTDLTRGTILQFQVVYELLQKKNLPSGFNLYSFTEERIPEVYRKNLSEFISGALHDTCNIAASAAEPTRTGN
ncbi:MAG: hypothetical protein RH862_15465 [Leptospiraceae bacterium]